ncbi:hypothetical protein Ahu01nite_098860 [Winogradskya humida]|uniref:Uncharacterized protein n=1 Tax=Winogradskya humida TaxID=113566 RepID=A0ABQ4A7V4_9ACTN|nr:hypothetical protein Ahu01nite_098860 [Actinoplanes humidus]
MNANETAERDTPAAAATSLEVGFPRDARPLPPVVFAAMNLPSPNTWWPPYNKITNALVKPLAALRPLMLASPRGRVGGLAWSASFLAACGPVASGLTTSRTNRVSYTKIKRHADQCRCRMAVQLPKRRDELRCAAVRNSSATKRVSA